MRNELLIMLGILLLALLIALVGPRSSESPKGTTKTFTITITTSSVWDHSKPLKELDLSSTLPLQQGAITVYFQPDQRELAQEVIQALNRSWQLVTRRLGIQLGAFGVALIALSESERAEIGGVYIRVKQQVRSFPQQMPRPPFPSVIPPDLKSLKADLGTRVSIYWTMPHEALHGAVSRMPSEEWSSDPMSLGLEEGLAEYIGHIVTKKLEPEVHRWMLEKRRKEIEDVLQGREYPTYDLTQEFLRHIELRFGEDSSQTPKSPTPPTELAGYGVSLAFWLQIAQKHGEGVIKTFWQRISKRGLPNAKEAARILSELTGEDIWQKLQSMDLHEVLQALEQAWAGP